MNKTAVRLGWQQFIEAAFHSAQREKITPWLRKDTARHYHWYPFINFGHYELARFLSAKDVLSSKSSYKKMFDQIVGYYRQGINKVLSKSAGNAFMRGVPYIWCSNNLTTSFAIQCYWYR